MTRTEAILRGALEDAEAAFGLLEATLRQCKQDPIADIVMKYRNRTNATLQVARALIEGEGSA